MEGKSGLRKMIQTDAKPYVEARDACGTYIAQLGVIK